VFNYSIQRESNGQWIVVDTESGKTVGTGSSPNQAISGSLRNPLFSNDSATASAASDSIDRLKSQALRQGYDLDTGQSVSPEITRSNTAQESVDSTQQVQKSEVTSSSTTTTNHAVPTPAAGAQNQIPRDSQSAENIAKGNNVSETGAQLPPGTNANTSNNITNESGRTSVRPSGEDSGSNTTTTQVSEQKQEKGSTGQTIGQILGENPLDQLADYSYAFTLAAIKPDVYNKIVKLKDYTYRPEHVVLATGSRNNDQISRDKNFTKDFFLTDLKFDTIVGLNSRTKGSNVINLTFKIIEPMGVSFFDRLYTMATELGARNYIELPYMLIIEFRGNTDDGLPVTLNQHTKYIPIKLINAKFKVTSAGSTYDITAIPYNHIAYQATEHGSTPVNLQVTAKTVADFFANNTNTSKLTEDLVNSQREAETRVSVLSSTAATDIDLGVTSAEDRRRAINEVQTNFKKKVFNASSYTQALNAFQQRLKFLKQVEEPDVYTFTIDEDIAKTLIVDPKLIPTNRLAFSSNSSNRQEGGAATETPKQGIFSINAGTSIVNVINMILRNSDYIKNQLTEKSQKISNKEDGVEIANAEEKPINWFKIIPSVTLEKFDPKRNTYSKVINFNIVKHIIYNTKSPLAPKSLPTRWLQEYQYIFTGKNRHIIDLDIDFNVLFFTMATADRQKWNLWNSAAGAPTDRDESKGYSPSDTFMPIKTIPVSSNIPLQIGSVDSDTAKGIAASDFYNTVLSSSRGDMINVRLTIIGDPRYIKQDDIFYNPQNSENLKTEILSKNNSIIFDYEERYVRLIFNTPVDYDSTTGLLETNGKYVTSRFSGLYRIIRVENSFSRGKFDQTLDLIKIFNEKNDFPVENQSPTETARREETPRSSVAPENQSAAETARLGRTGFVGNTMPGKNSIIPSPAAIIQPPAIPSLQTFASVPRNFSDPFSDPNTNYNETPALSGVTDQDRLEALRIQNQSNNPDAISAEQVASNRRLNQRLTSAFGIPEGATVDAPSQEDSYSTGG